MNTKILMVTSAVFMMISGLGLTFIPQEIFEFLNAGLDPSSVLFAQLLGSLYLGFGMLNWMSKNSVIGGIYNKPLVVGNLAHFLISFFTLIRIVGKPSGNEFPFILILTTIYTVFTLCFGFVFFKHPNSLKHSN